MPTILIALLIPLSSAIILFLMNVSAEDIYKVTGWISWACLMYLAINASNKCNKMIDERRLFQWTIAVQSLFLWTLVFVFYLTKLTNLSHFQNLYILLLTPIIYYLALFIALSNIPFISAPVLAITLLFMKFNTVGYGGKNSYNIYATNLLTQNTSIAWERILYMVRKHSVNSHSTASAIDAVDFDKIIGRYLLMDDIEPSRFNKNWCIINDLIHNRELCSQKGDGTPSLLSLIPSLREILNLGFPSWFIAAYPDVIKWAWNKDITSIADVISATPLPDGIDTGKSEEQIFAEIFDYDTSKDIMRRLIECYKPKHGGTLECQENPMAISSKDLMMEYEINSYHARNRRY